MATLPPNGHLALVVEDEVLIRMFAATALRDAGFATLEAATGEQALQYLSKEAAIDALVTDIDLSGQINGFGLAWRAHSLSVAVLVMSGRFHPPSELLPPGAKFHDKPFGEDQIVGALWELLDCDRRHGPH